MKILIALCLIGIAWVLFTSKLDEKRSEVYSKCQMVETIDGEYKCVIE